MADGLFQRTLDCLLAADVARKLALTAQLKADFAAGRCQNDDADCPVQAIAEAGRPEKPIMVPSHHLKPRSVGSREGRASMLHAIAHIEFCAINLALDAAYRFRGLPQDYYGDWLQVAQEECEHFSLVRACMQEQGYDYGDFPAHGALWELANLSAHDVLARMALLPRMQEARGLDVTPPIMEKFRSINDLSALAALEVILRDEIGHVAIGDKWFRHLCAERQLPVAETFKHLLLSHGQALPQTPMNTQARLQAGFTPEELASFGRPA